MLPTVVFAGTPAFAVPALRAIIESDRLNLVGVYTQPDRPAGRGRKLTPSPVKQCAQAAGIDVFQPKNFREQATLDTFAACNCDLLVVAAYGIILPQSLLDIPAHETVNIHASILPRWRGAAPIQRAIMANDKTTGISIMRVVAALDAGPVFRRDEIEIHSDETGGSLHDRLADLGAKSLLAALDEIFKTPTTPQEQDESQVTYAHKIESADRVVDFNRPSSVVDAHIRALSPYPGAKAELGGVDFQLTEAHVLESSAEHPPGEIVAASSEGIDVATLDGVLRVTGVKPPGKRAMNVAEYINGNQQFLAAGHR